MCVLKTRWAEWDIKHLVKLGRLKKKNISNNTVKLKIMLALRYALPYYLPPKDVGQIRFLNYRK